MFPLPSAGTWAALGSRHGGGTQAFIPKGSEFFVILLYLREEGEPFSSFPLNSTIG